VDEDEARVQPLAQPVSDAERTSRPVRLVHCAGDHLEARLARPLLARSGRRHDHRARRPARERARDAANERRGRRSPSTFADDEQVRRLVAGDASELVRRHADLHLQLCHLLHAGVRSRLAQQRQRGIVVSGRLVRRDVRERAGWGDRHGSGDGGVHEHEPRLEGAGESPGRARCLSRRIGRVDAADDRSSHSPASCSC
jgi:hypothetical protein